MKNLINSLKGDKVIWAFVALLALFSFMPVYSASTNLAYMLHGSGNAMTYLVKHLAHIFVGFFIIYQVHKIPYHYFKNLSLFLLPIVWLLLLYTLLFGVEKGNASRWILIPYTGITFQTSTIASIILMIFVARYLSKNFNKKITFKSSLTNLWIYVAITVGLILPGNFSTAALIFLMVLMLTFIGNYPIKYLGIIVGSGFLVLSLFFSIAKFYENKSREQTPKIFQRVKTWENRILSFNDKQNTKGTVKDYQDKQIVKAQVAIASGNLYGLGPGKSVQKNFLSQSSSDFIFAIIVEEYGLIGAIGIISVYLLLLLRFVVAAHKAKSIFGKLLVIGLGFPIIFQALINMCVAVELLPVTGQTLPLISSGGSSIWMTCFAIGIIISVTKKEDEIAQELAEKQKRTDALKKLIDKQVQEDEQEDEIKQSVDDDYSIIENPLNAVLKK